MARSRCFLPAATLALLLLAIAADARHARLLRTRREVAVARRSPMSNDVLSGGKTNDTFLPQKLDHTNPVDKRRWNQRYFTDASHYRLGGPAIVLIGGEFPQKEKYLKNSVVIDIAKALGGKAFLLEHRYYGNSHPTEDLSVSNLRWLSANQALGDVAYFIEYLRKQGEVTADGKVVVYGCSYSGNLAAWARLKYPHLVHAAVAASAPVRAQVAFPEYLEEVARVIRQYGGKACMDRVKQAISKVDKLINTAEGLNQVKAHFNVCEPFTGTPEDKENLLMAMTEPFSKSVEAIEKGNTSHIQVVCQAMAANTGSVDLLVRSLAAISKAYNKGTCLDAAYETDLTTNRNETWAETDSDENNDDDENEDDDTDDFDEDADSRQWFYQTCTEFGYFPTMTVESFGLNGFSVQSSEKLCEDVFGAGYDGETVRTGVANTNLQFGADEPELNRVIFVNSEMDPWRTLSVNESLHELAPHILIKDAHHCQGISSHGDESDPFKDDREQIIGQVRRFLDDTTLTRRSMAARRA